LSAVGEQDPVLIEQIDLPIRAQRARDSARVVLKDAIQRDRVAVGLLELDDRVAADVEAAPVQRGVGRLLRDVEAVTAHDASRGTARDPARWPTGAARARAARHRQLLRSERLHGEQRADRRDELA